MERAPPQQSQICATQLSDCGYDGGDDDVDDDDEDFDDEEDDADDDENSGDEEIELTCERGGSNRRPHQASLTGTLIVFVVTIKCVPLS